MLNTEALKAYELISSKRIDDARKRAKQIVLVKRMIDQYYPEAVMSPALWKEGNTGSDVKKDGQL